MFVFAVILFQILAIPQAHNVAGPSPIALPIASILTGTSGTDDNDAHVLDVPELANTSPLPLTRNSGVFSVPMLPDSRLIYVPSRRLDSSFVNERRMSSSEPSRKEWITLIVAEHSAAVFDGWSTRRAISRGAVETNPLIMPFAGSSAVYGALQVTPVLLDFLSRQMIRSNRGAIQRAWWLPQTISTLVSVSAGVHNCVKR